MLIYQRENGGEYARDSPSVFREWEAGDPSEVQLVACVATTFDDAVPVVERFEWTYEVRLLEAATGNELGRTTYAHTLQTDFDVGYEVPLLGLINDYQPADAPPLSSFDTASRIVCDGESVPGVDPFDPADRPHVHDVPMYWRTDAPVWSEVTGLWPEGEHSAQLVFCVRGTVTPNSKKSKTCRSRSPPGTMQVRSTRYAIELREVATGAILGQRVFLGDLRCPEVWKIRNPPLVYLAEVPFDAIVSWASRWVERG